MTDKTLIIICQHESGKGNSMDMKIERYMPFAFLLPCLFLPLSIPSLSLSLSLFPILCLLYIYYSLSLFVPLSLYLITDDFRLCKSARRNKTTNSYSVQFATFKKTLINFICVGYLDLLL